MKTKNKLNQFMLLALAAIATATTVGCASAPQREPTSDEVAANHRFEKIMIRHEAKFQR